MSLVKIVKNAELLPEKVKKKKNAIKRNINVVLEILFFLYFLVFKSTRQDFTTYHNDINFVFR